MDKAHIDSRIEDQNFKEATEQDIEDCYREMARQIKIFKKRYTVVRKKKTPVKKMSQRKKNEQRRKNFFLKNFNFFVEKLNMIDFNIFNMLKLIFTC